MSFAALQNTNFTMHNFKLSGNAFEPHATKLYESSNVINVSKTGRIASLAAGAFLYSLSARKKQTLIKAMLRYGGTYFLYRGMSGNCPITAALKKEEYQIHAPAVK